MHTWQLSAAVVVVARKAHTATHLSFIRLALERWSMQTLVHHARRAIHEVVLVLILRLLALQLGLFGDGLALRGDCRVVIGGQLELC